METLVNLSLWNEKGYEMLIEKGYICYKSMKLLNQSNSISI